MTSCASSGKSARIASMSRAVSAGAVILQGYALRMRTGWVLDERALRQHNEVAKIEHVRGSTPGTEESTVEFDI
ncbi:hypothetical protein GCM10009808_22270 [Microbacterium sediminicola]|uniref:Uncharacterized protein n=1 Tax=Microbacterium sediminicola TaxID=415210 RepID=A0ABP4UE38_9MICO